MTDERNGNRARVLIHLLVIGCAVWASSAFLPEGVSNLIPVVCVCVSAFFGAYFFVRVFTFEAGDLGTLSLTVSLGQALLAAIVAILTALPLLICVAIGFMMSAQVGRVTLEVSAISVVGFILYWSIVPAILRRGPR